MMLIEHSFVTTLEAPQALELSFHFLRDIGFALSSTPDSADLSSLRALEMTRGAGRQFNPQQSKQVVRLDFDRGRMTVAGSISPKSRGNFQLTSTSGRDPSATSTWGRFHAERMIALANALEALLAKAPSLNETVHAWQISEIALSRKVRSARIAAIIKGPVAVLLFVLVTLCAIAFISK